MNHHEIEATISAAFIVPVSGTEALVVKNAQRALFELIADKELFEKRWNDAVKDAARTPAKEGHK